MLTEEKRRAIARKFLEENFGKRSSNEVPKMIIRELAKLENAEKAIEMVAKAFFHDFELWRSYDSMDEGTNEAKAFEVFYAPYISTSDKQFIAVSDSRKELNEIVERVFPEDRRKYGFIEYDRYGKYYIAYD